MGLEIQEWDAGREEEENRKGERAEEEKPWWTRSVSPSKCSVALSKQIDEHGFSTPSSPQVSALGSDPSWLPRLQTSCMGCS